MPSPTHYVTTWGDDTRCQCGVQAHKWNSTAIVDGVTCQRCRRSLGMSQYVSQYRWGYQDRPSDMPPD